MTGREGATTMKGLCPRCGARLWADEDGARCIFDGYHSYETARPSLPLGEWPSRGSVPPRLRRRVNAPLGGGA